MLSQGLILSLPYTNHWYRLTYVRNFSCNPQNHVLLTYLIPQREWNQCTTTSSSLKFSDWKTIADRSTVTFGALQALVPNFTTKRQCKNL